MKKPYLGLLLLILACVLMQAFGKSAENMRLLYYVPEAFGYYTGYLHNPLSVSLWVMLIVAIPVLFFFAFKLMWAGPQSLITQRRRLVPLGIYILSFSLCIAMPSVHRFTLQFASSVDAVVFQDRTDPLGYTEEFDEHRHIVGMRLHLNLHFNRFNSKNEEFKVKLIRLDNPSKEYEVPWGRTALEGRGSIDFDYIPEYLELLKETGDLRFKLVIYDETQSKTFNLYFDGWDSPDFIHFVTESHIMVYRGNADNATHTLRCSLCYHYSEGVSEHISSGYQYDSSQHWQTCTLCGAEYGRDDHNLTNYAADKNTTYCDSSCGFGLLDER